MIEEKLEQDKNTKDRSGGSYVAINSKFDKLIMSLRTAVEKGEGMLDKEAISYDDNGNVFFTYSYSRHKWLRWDK